MYKPLGSLLLLAALAVDVLCAPQSRERRSDDRPALDSVVGGLSKQVTELGAQVTALHDTLIQQQQQYDQLRTKFDSSQRMVAFTARNSAGTFNVAAQGTVVYNRADLNLGTGFDTVTGVFTCPAPGLYLFFVNCDAANSHVDEDVGILVDGVRVAGCYAHPTHDQGAGMAAVRLRTGQKVWVKLFRESARNIAGGTYNTFSGFLIKSED